MTTLVELKHREDIRRPLAALAAYLDHEAAGSMPRAALRLAAHQTRLLLARAEAHAAEFSQPVTILEA